MQLDGKVAVVTGGASGLGRAAVEHLLARGARVMIFDLNEEKCRQLCEQHPRHCAYAIVNVTDEAAVVDGIQAALERFGALHICVNCAGGGDATRTVGKQGPYPLERFRAIVDLNLVGTFNVLRLAAEAMQSNQPLTPDGERGVIINTASVAAMDGQIGQAAYAASKAGIVGMTLPIARDLGKLGIRVNTICPGVFDTELMALAPASLRDGLASIAQFPVRLGAPPEFAQLVAHLCENGYINGETIRLDAGMRMPPR